MLLITYAPRFETLANWYFVIYYLNVYYTILNYLYWLLIYIIKWRIFTLGRRRSTKPLFFKLKQYLVGMLISLMLNEIRFYPNIYRCNFIQSVAKILILISFIHKGLVIISKFVFVLHYWLPTQCWSSTFVATSLLSVKWDWCCLWNISKT